MTQGQDKKKKNIYIYIYINKNTLKSQEDPTVVTWDEGKRA